MNNEHNQYLFEKITLLHVPGQLTMMHNSFQYIQKLDETLRHNAPGVTMSRTLYIYYCPFYRCPVVVTINEHQWEVVFINCYGNWTPVKGTIVDVRDIVTPHAL